MSGSLESLAAPFQLAGFTSFDANAPGGVVNVPVGPGYLRNFPGITGVPANALPPDSAALPTTTVTPGDAPASPPPFGYTTDNPPTTPGWFWNSQTGRFEYSPGGGAAPTSTAPNAAGDQVPGLGIINNPKQAVDQARTGIINAVTGPLTWIEELAIRGMMVLVGLVLLGGGIYLAGQRAARARTIPQLVRAPITGPRR